jgi:hypothetical protein
MKQVWFCGVHTDVGGGYREQALSDITLLWMQNKAVEHGLRIYKNNKNPAQINPDPNGIMHNSRSTVLTALLYQRKVRKWNMETHGSPIIHKSVLERTFNKDNKPSPKYTPWILKPEQPWIKNGSYIIEP